MKISNSLSLGKDHIDLILEIEQRRSKLKYFWIKMSVHLQKYVACYQKRISNYH